MKQKIVLASQSPFRKKLLEKLELTFETAAPLCDEDLLKSQFKGKPKELCAFLAKEKALSLKEHFPDDLILGSDQSLFLGEKTLGKGKSFEGACRQLKKCSGKTAELITSVYIYDGQAEDVEFENITRLFFRNLSLQQIENYVLRDEPYSCAGSFMFEKTGSFLFEKIKCCDITAIEGLPLTSLTSFLCSKGFKPLFF